MYVDMSIVVGQKCEDILNTHQYPQESIHYGISIKQPNKPNYSSS